MNTTLKRIEAIQSVLQFVDHQFIVHANGMISRESFHLKPRKKNFYMIGSMGVNAFIAIGMALNSPAHQFIVFDGDGNLLMALNSLPQASYHQLHNFYHIVFDNEAHASTGNQPTISHAIHLDHIASASGFKYVYHASSKTEIQSIMPQFLQKKGPAFLLIKVQKGNIPNIPRINLTPQQMTEQIKNYF